MASAVKTQPNHYERLGLAPGASDDDVAKAFAREMSPLRPHSVGELAKIGAAYAVLRDPARRRAYDASIAPGPEPVLDPAPDPHPAERRDRWPFIASARIGSAELPPIDTLPRPVAREPREDAAPKPLPEPFVAPERPRSFEPEPRRASPHRIRDDRSLQDIFEDRFRLVADGPRDWKRPAGIVAGLFGSVALLGVGLGWYASRDIQPAQAEAAVAFPIPHKAVEQEPLADSPAAAASVVPRVRNEGKSRTAVTVRPRAPRAPSEQTTVAPEQQQRADDIPDIPTEKVAALTAPDSAGETPAAMPLSDAVIARTIGRIGYACGSVTSTTAVEGSAGAFKVTCSSGDSYRAAPVRGRYHFKKW